MTLEFLFLHFWSPFSKSNIIRKIEPATTSIIDMKPKDHLGRFSSHTSRDS
jgi:hypothetical protein